MELGYRIRSLREELGVSQADFAKAVYVARQTVSNWENNKTLPDVESLKLIAAYFGITVDELLDAEAVRLIDETAQARHDLLVWIASSAVYLLWIIIEFTMKFTLVESLAGADKQGAALSLLVVRLVVFLWYAAAAGRAERIRRDRELSSALQVVAFIEGRRPGATLPSTILYRLILPYFSVCWALLLMVVFVSLLVLSVM